MIRLIFLVVCMTVCQCSAAESVADLAKGMVGGGALPAAWKLQAATAEAAVDGGLRRLKTEAGRHWRTHDDALIASPSAQRFAVASYTVPAGAAGFYAIQDSALRPAKAAVELRVFVRRAAGRDEAPAVYTSVAADELFDFDTFLGYVDAGDTIQVAVGPSSGPVGEAAVDFSVVRTPAYPVSTFAGKAADWAVLRDVPAGSAAGRIVAWNGDTVPDKLAIAPGADRETIAAFRVSHSGYYALHDATASATAEVQAKIYAGRSAAPRRAVKVASSAVSLGCDLGYVEKGGVVYIAFSNAGSAEATVTLAASLVDWAPRTPPLRVARGEDGLLDVLDPADPATPIDIPQAKWVTVPASTEDASQTIRDAFERAKGMQGDGYTGVRLQRGATYTVASEQAGGDLFALRDLQRIVFDGNGATLNIASKEFPRKQIKLFHVSNCQKLVLADFTMTATSVPFAIGRVTKVGPSESGNQTVTFRLEPGSLDPIADIARNGNASAYCYDPDIPGRLAVGTWSHYPGAGSNGQPSLRETAEKGVFQHTVTRTNQSIPGNAKWLIKNKGAGLAYLTTRGGTEDLTLWKVTGRASGGGLLYFWQTSRINILNCSFEPEGDNWIGSSSDAVHGRGREGVWIEDTIIRGVCEDIMNTYATTNVVVADDDARDNVYSIRGLVRPGGEGGGQFRAPNPPSRENVDVGDKLVFFNPRTGHVLGHSVVREINDGRFTMSTNIPDVDYWDAEKGKGSTTVYNTSAAARFVVRDSHFMDSMRIGIYIKARGGVMFGNTFDGLPSPAIFVVNEPEWPEGPPGTHVWIQGNTFTQNNYGYMSRHRAFMVVDPADISIYTRHMRQAGSPNDFTALITRGQYANSHVKIIGNVFDDWRGSGVSVRNARNVKIEDNLFLPPAEDDVLRQTLARDPARKGRYAGIFLDSVSGGRVAGNRFIGLPENDQPVIRDGQVDEVMVGENVAESLERVDVRLPFSEWFGQGSHGAGASAELRGVSHGVGRLGAGLVFASNESRAVIRLPGGVSGKGRTQFSMAMWLCCDDGSSPQAVYTQGPVAIAIEHGRLRGKVEGHPALDLGPAVSGIWQHVALSFDGAAGTVRGMVDGVEVATVKAAATLDLPAEAVLGQSDGSQAYRGVIDELYLLGRALTAADVSRLSMRK